MQRYTYVKLTAQQAALVEEYHSLIYAALRRSSRDPDEDYGAGAVGLCKAALTYPSDNPPCSFPAYAYNRIRCEIHNHRQTLRRHNIAALSLDATLPGTENFTLADTVPDYTDFSGPEIEDLYALLKAKRLAHAFNMVKPREKTLSTTNIPQRRVKVND